MNTPNYSISLTCIVLLLLFSCSKPEHHVPEEFVDPCQNGGEYSCGGLWCFCICPDGFCGELCETEGTTSDYGNYLGKMICQDDTVMVHFEVKEYICSLKTRLVFNDGEFTARYWKSPCCFPGVPATADYSISEKPNILVNYRGVDILYPDNGKLTPDSLTFWVLEYENSPDTCFYVGVRN